MKRALIGLAIVVGCAGLPVTVPWGRTIGGKNVEASVAISEANKDDSAFVAAQSTNSFADGTYLWLLKVGKLSEIIDQKLLKSDKGESNPHLAPTDDGGAYLAATTYSFGARNADAFVARLDANLAFQWQLRIGSKHDDTITQLATTSTGDLLAVGFTTLDDANDTDGMIVRIGADATVRDAHSIGNISSERLFAITPTDDGGMYVAGQISDTTGEDAFVAKLTGEGQLTWAIRMHGPDPEGFRSIAETSTGWVAAGGTDFSPAGKSKGLVVIGNATGSVLSQHTLALGDNSAFTTVLTSGNDYMLIGNTATTAGASDAWIVRLQGNGSSPGYVFGGDGNDTGATARRSTTGDVWLSSTTTSYSAQVSDILLLRLGADVFLPSPQRRAGDAVRVPANLEVQTSIATSTPLALEFEPTRATLENTQGKIRPIAGN